MAATLAGVGVSAGAGHALAAEPEASAEAEPPPTPPRICLSDIDIEGEVERPEPCLSVGREAEPPPAPRTSPHAPPQVCLSVMPESADRPFRHDGFYLRVGTGAGLLVVDVESSAAPRDSEGVALSVQLDGGMTLARGLVSGFSLGFLRAPSPGNGFGAAEVWRLGPLLEWYPDPAGGLHIGVSPAPVAIRVQRGGEDLAGLGFGAAVWCGYDAWLGEDWSLGTRLSGLGAWGGRASDSQESRLSARALALELSLAYH